MAKDNIVKSSGPSLTITMKRETLANMGIYVDLDVNTLHFEIATEYDQEFSNFLDQMPDHLTDEEQSRLTESIDSAYTSIMVQRCFNKASRLHRAEK